jgi:hypothetical protein
MAITNKKGRIGSQRLLQAAVAEYPDLLNKALQREAPRGQAKYRP